MRAAMTLEARLLEAAINLADQIAGDAVGFDDGKRTLKRHSNRPPQDVKTHGVPVRLGDRQGA